jgi:3-isopropylmalate/(R)-2-methylmalate dehydratase large subunit
VIVSGRSKGCGSSRETAPYSELAAACQLVIAKSIEKIYGQNCQNIGLLTSTDFGLIERIKAGEEIPIERVHRGPRSDQRGHRPHGGLFEYNKARLAGEVHPGAGHDAGAADDAWSRRSSPGTRSPTPRRGPSASTPSPGDALFVRTDVRFSHEYVTPMADALFRHGARPRTLA